MENQKLCRKCFKLFEKLERCPNCGSPIIISHPELLSLNIAHMDCDSFYASVEKRDRPELIDKPVIMVGVGVVLFPPLAILHVSEESIQQCLCIVH